MSFIEQEASYRYEIIDGKPVKIITPQSEVTLTNMKTGKLRNIQCKLDVPDYWMRSVRVHYIYNLKQKN